MTKRFAGKGRTEGVKADVSRTQNEGGTTNNYGPVRADIPDGRQSSAKKGQRTVSRLVIAAIGLGILAVSIVIAAKQFGNRAEGTSSVKKPGLVQMDAAPPQTGPGEAQSNAYRVGVERGGMARVFEDDQDGFRIQLDGIRFDKGSNQYMVSFRLSSANSEVLEVTDGIVSGEKIYTYPANGKFKIRVLSAEENLADFSIETMN